MKDRSYRDFHHSTKIRDVDDKRTVTSKLNVETKQRKDGDLQLLDKSEGHLLPNSRMLSDLRHTTTEGGHSKAKYSNMIIESKHTSKLMDEISTHKSFNKKSKTDKEAHEAVEKNFVLYEIGNSDIWYAVQVQLFEKLNTPEGKTVWNDITKGEVAR